MDMPPPLPPPVEPARDPVQHEPSVPPPLPPQAFDPKNVAALIPESVRYEQQPAGGRRKAGLSAVFALLIVAPSVLVVGRAAVRMMPSSAQGVAAPAAGSTAAKLTMVAPDPLASAGVGAAARPAELFDRATADLRAAQARPSRASRRWAESGAFDLGAVRSPQDLDRRLEVLESLAKETREARLAGDGVMQQLRADLLARDAGAVQRELWVAQWAAEVKFEDDRQVALATEKFLAAGRTQLRMLRENWGRWSLERAADKVRFDDAALQNRFDRQAAQLGMAELQLKDAVSKARANVDRGELTAGKPAR